MAGADFTDDACSREGQAYLLEAASGPGAAQVRPRSEGEQEEPDP